MIATPTVHKARKRIQRNQLHVEEPTKRETRKLKPLEQKQVQWKNVMKTFKAEPAPGMVKRFMTSVDGFATQLSPDRAKSLYLAGWDIWIEEDESIGPQTFYNLTLRHKQVIADQLDFISRVLDTIDVTDDELKLLSTEGKKLINAGVSTINDVQRTLELVKIEYPIHQEGNHDEQDNGSRPVRKKARGKQAEPGSISIQGTSKSK